MEIYKGVKFNHQRKNQSFSYDLRLESLNHWAHLFSQLGLAPVHASGAYGNFSYRIKNGSFIITKSGMIPGKNLDPDNYCLVSDVEVNSNSIFYDGKAPPSSECLLHQLIYQKKPEIQAILHGHCVPLNSCAASLKIPVTSKCYPYGTLELANSALEMLNFKTNFFVLKDHGFVALAEDIDKAGKLTLEYFGKLIKFLVDNYSSITI